MGITNYQIDKVEGKAEKRGSLPVDVKESFSITNVEKKTDKILEVGWSFNVDYKGIGNLSMEGTLTYFSDDVTDAYEERKKGKEKTLSLKGEALREVTNFVLRRGIIEAILLAKTLQLPAPIQLPSVKVETAEKKE